MKKINTETVLQSVLMHYIVDVLQAWSNTLWINLDFLQACINVLWMCVDDSQIFLLFMIKFFVIHSYFILQIQLDVLQTDFSVLWCFINLLWCFVNQLLCFTIISNVLWIFSDVLQSFSMFCRSFSVFYDHSQCSADLLQLLWTFLIVMNIFDILWTYLTVLNNFISITVMKSLSSLSVHCWMNLIIQLSKVFCQDSLLIAEWVY